ncbi:MAG: UDP-N-acetylmuramoyl-tripeptide--D-alanyl-D-alanine ligase [Gammaproteobacteria bacterium]|nr:UDP-N-acetylmuramoyl-tripeptide--D-alanyl-D-alanine ligase [Gammaproteobacteria bacterium]
MTDSLAAAANNMNGELHGNDCAFAGISTDTRSIRSGELFFALQGPNFDGHEHLAAAIQMDAAGAVVSRACDDGIPQIRVEDTRLALGQFGAAWRASKDVTVVGVTGSNGKTTLKEMIAGCLSTRAATLATEGNLNNDIGMPLMLARIEDQHDYAVIEMGANHAGEIAYLVSLASPDVVVITNAGAAHLEGFGSIEGVAKAKGEILQNARRPAVAVLNADDDYFDYWSTLVTDVRMLSFGFGAGADVRASNIRATAHGSEFDLSIAGEEKAVSLPLPGIHNVRNACAAAAVATALEIDADYIAGALQKIAPVEGRIRPLQGINDCTLFDDSYNANPLSVAAAAEFLASLEGDSWLVLGDMKELGDDAKELHREVGASARASGISRLFALGDLCKHSVAGFGPGASWYSSLDDLLHDVLQASESTNVLVKGSRSMHMERVVDALRASDPVRKEA